VTELIVALLELCIWDSNWDALYFLKHTLVDAAFEIVLVRVGVGTKSSNPEFTLDPRSHAANGIVQSTVGVRIRFSMPSGLSDEGIVIYMALC
jgi:hypothetical protein